MQCSSRRGFVCIEQARHVVARNVRQRFVAPRASTSLLPLLPLSSSAWEPRHGIPIRYQGNAAQQQIHTSARSSAGISRTKTRSDGPSSSLRSGEPFRRRAVTQKKQPQEEAHMNPHTAPQHNDDFQFFTSQREAQLSTRREAHHQPLKAKQLLFLCDTAIYRSRESADAEHLHEVRKTLQQATTTYLEILYESDVRNTRDLFYETYLVRSAYLHIVRIVAALNGVQCIDAYVHMIIDYLQWERRLLDLGVVGPVSAERPLEDAISHAKQSTSPKQKEKEIDEAIYFLSPLPQDVAPTLFDIFRDLSVLSWDQIELDHERKAMPSKGRALAFDLLDAVEALPPSMWRRPISVDWMRFRHSRVPSFRSADEIIASCYNVLTRKLLLTEKLCDAYKVFRRSAAYWEGRLPSHRASRYICDTLMNTRRALEKGPNSDATPSLLEEYLEVLHLALDDLHKGGMEVILFNGWRRRVVPIRWHHVIICAMRLDRLPITKENGRIAKIKDLLRAWIQLVASGKEQRTFHGDHLTGLQSRLVDKLTNGYFEPFATDVLTLELMSHLSRNEAVKTSHDATVNVILRNATTRLRPTLIQVALQAARLLQLNSLHPEDAAAQAARGLGQLLVVALLRDAVDRQLADRLIVLIALLERILTSATPSVDNAKEGIGLPQLRRELGVSPKAIVFTLYPSLDLTRHDAMGNARGRYKRHTQVLYDGAESDRSCYPSRRMDSSAIPFNPSVLFATLHLVMRTGQTGLAERLWRLIRRAQIRQKFDAKRRKRSQGGYTRLGSAIRDSQTAATLESSSWDVPVSAYTTMLRAYATEARRSLRGVRGLFSGKYRGRSSSGLHRSSRFTCHLGSTRLPIFRLARGWGSQRLDDNRQGQADHIPALLAARIRARECYQELRESWPKETRLAATGRTSTAAPAPAPSMPPKHLCPDAPLFRALLAVFHVGASMKSRINLRGLGPADVFFLRDTVFTDMVYFGVPLEACGLDSEEVSALRVDEDDSTNGNEDAGPSPSSEISGHKI